MRASDRDRDRAASVINEALAEGRLTAEEHSERLDAIYAAKTHADIVPLVDDLPQQHQVVAPTGPASEGALVRRSSRIIAVLSGASRKGIWHAEPVIDVVAVLGGVELDFRDAVLPGREVRLRTVTVLGGLDVTVPPEMRVVDSGVAIMAGREIAGDSEESLGADAPVLYISGASVLGGVVVTRKARDQRQGSSRPQLEP